MSMTEIGFGASELRYRIDDTRTYMFAISVVVSVLDLIEEVLAYTFLNAEMRTSELASSARRSPD